MKHVFYTLLTSLCIASCGKSDPFFYYDSDSDSDADADSDSDTDNDSDSDSDSDSQFVSVWKTNNPSGSTDYQIRLPLEIDGEYSFTVYWGDGTHDTVTKWNDETKTHTYDHYGEYEVRISGLIKGWSFNDMGDRKKILEIKNWGPLDFGDTERQFEGCENLTISATDVPKLSKTTSFGSAFRGCDVLTAIPSLNDWDTSQITNMSATFYGAFEFNQNLSDLDTSSVTDMSGTFYGAESFNGDLSGWDTSKVIDMS